MKKIICIAMCLGISGALYAQTPTDPTATPTSIQQNVPNTDPVPNSSNTRPDLNSPQTPARPTDMPSEDTLIKDRKSSGAIIQDTLVPSGNRNSDRVERRKGRKGTSEQDDTTSVAPARKP